MLLVLFVILQVCTCIEQTTVAYFSFTGADASLPVSISAGNYTSYEQLMHTDDSPFQLLKLPWIFNFLGTNTDEIYLNPNGALHLDGKQPCPPLNYFGADQCTVDTSYLSVIAGFLTDLDPSQSKNGTISSISTNDAVIVTFSNISYYNSSLSNTFRMTLYRDSHIEIAYVQIRRSSSLPHPETWASGLRGAATNPYAYFTSAQRQLAATGWGTAVPSVYPAQADVRTGNTFTICPVSRAWCVQPSILSRNASQNAAGSVTLSALLLSCVEKVEYGILLSNTSAIRSAEFIPCATIGTSASLSCSIASILALNLTADTVYVAPVWRVSGSSGPFAPLPVEAMMLTLVNGLDATITVGCANNLGNSTCGMESCALCAGNYTCLDLPCTEPGSTIQVTSTGNSAVFDRINCNGTCSNAIQGLENYFLDGSAVPQCCEESEMDCTGICRGPGVVALNSDFSVYCCENAALVDCAGICDGTARRDACGTCQGTDFTGLGCFSTEQITVSTGFEDGGLHPIFDVSDNTTAGLQRTVVFNVTNRSPFAISASLTENSADDDRRAPELTIPAAAVLIDVNATSTFSVTASIERLYQGNMTQWATKSVLVRYFRVMYTPAVYTMEVGVYLGAVNCTSITSSDTCIRLPACIYCLTSPNMRILREEQALPASVSQSRRLFMELVPEALRNAGDDLEGVCGDGWTNADCANIAPDAFVSGAVRDSSHVSKRVITAVILVNIVLGRRHV